MQRVRSGIRFFDSSSGAPVDALKNARMKASSVDLGWPGLLVEIGQNHRWNVEEVGVADHFIALNTDDRPLHFSVKRGEGFRDVVMPPGSVWFCPAGESFSHRVRQPCGFILATLGPARLGRIAGDDGIRFERGYAISNPQLAYVLRALGAEMNDAGANGPAFADALASALAIGMVETFARAPMERALPSPRKSGVAGVRLSPHILSRVRERVEVDLTSELTVSSLADEAGLSPAHFTRAFKASTGLPPYQYIVRRRLEEARMALQRPGVRVLEIAFRFGFADQAHFTRMFRQRFGVTPGEIVKEAQSRRPTRA